MLILALWAHAGAEESSALLHLTIDECEGQVIADKSGYLSQADFLHPVPDRNTAKGTTRNRGAGAPVIYMEGASADATHVTSLTGPSWKHMSTMTSPSVSVPMPNRSPRASSFFADHDLTIESLEVYTMYSIYK